MSINLLNNIRLVFLSIFNIRDQISITKNTSINEVTLNFLTNALLTLLPVKPILS